MKRLFRAEALVTVYLVAKDEDDAKHEVDQAFRDELRNNGLGDDAPLHVQEVTDPADVDEIWRDSCPYVDAVDRDVDCTCVEYLEKIRAWREAEGQPKPLPGQLSLIPGIPDVPVPNPSPVEDRVIVSRKGCGCISAVANLGENFHWSDWSEFYLEASRRRCEVQIMPRRQFRESIVWQCPKHPRPASNKNP